jgi:hypothetical protein
LLFLFTEKRGAGKDTFVKALKYFYYLQEEKESECNSFPLSEEFIKLQEGGNSVFDTDRIYNLPFADEVKKELCRINPEVDFEKLMSDYEYKTRYRKELIDIGDGYRKADPGIWVDKHFLALKEYCSVNKGKIICIPDLRYSTGNSGDEMEYAKDVGKDLNILSMQIKINTSFSSRLYRMSEKARKAYLHFGLYNPSEVSMDHIADAEFTYVCNNDTNIKYGFSPDIEKTVKDILKIHSLIQSL